MKKKVKLFSTIASLCLAVALMAFGVWAAGAVTFKTTSKVTFEAASDVFGTYTAKVVNTASGATDETISVKRIYGTDNDWVEVAGGKKGALMGSGASFADQTVKAAGNTVTFTYTFKNDSPYAVYYKFTFEGADFESVDCVLETKCAAAAAANDDAITVGHTLPGTEGSGAVAVGGEVSATVTVTVNCTHIDTVNLIHSMSLKVDKTEITA